MSIKLHGSDNNLDILSVSLMEASMGISNQKPISDGYLQGAILMGFTTIFWSIYHIITKYVYTNNPGVNCYDTVQLFEICDVRISLSINYN